MEMQRTLVLLKPDALQRGLIGRILTRFEEKGLRLLGMKMMALGKDLLDEHYAHLKDQPFFADIVSFMTNAPVVALCLEGFEAVDVVRGMCGITNSRQAVPGTIRGDFGMSIRSNLVHASDSVENAIVEIERFFKADEVFAYSKLLDSIIYIDKTS